MPDESPPAVPNTVATLAHLWETREARAWDDGSYLDFGRRAIALGEPAFAFDILHEGLARAPGHDEMNYAPGSVYVTEQMASLLVASGTTAFTCDYLGTMELAKHFGASRLYRLRRSDESE